MLTPDDLVRREVIYCVSALVSTLASAAYTGESSAEGTDLQSLAEQAFDLASSVPDYESAAREEGWAGPDKDEFGATCFRNATDGQTWAARDWQALCEDPYIEPLYREVYEHWIVSDWLAEMLEERGEKVDHDFAGLTIWARTTTGQSISIDSVIVDICAALASAA